MRKNVFHPWIRIGLIGGLMFLWGSTTLCAQEKEELSALLEKLKSQFGTNRTFQAAYTRDLLPKVSSVLPSAAMQAEGRLWFASPNKLRLDQRQPRAEQLISNGEKVWWYIPGEKTVQIFLLKDYGQQVKPIADFFSGLGSLEEHFQVRMDRTLPEEAPFHALILEPKKPQPELNRIDLRLAKETLLPLEFTYYNLLGDGTRFRLREVKTGFKVAGSAFEFTPPPGTRVIPAPPAVPGRGK